MPYEVTATRKRPQTFAELVGQEFVAATLTSALRQGAIAHAYLFAGPRGVGKTSVARILAKALNCEQGPTDTPCGTCASCLEITRGAALDVIEIDGASNTSVNDVREIRDEVLFAPQKGRKKVYIIDEVHMLSNSAFNALLKTIEEPPPYVVFIFATTEVHKVPATIRSRCQQYNFRLISAAEIRGKLREAAAELGVKAEDKALTWIAKEATGSLRDAYTLLDQVVSFSGGSVTLEAIREKLGVLGIDELNAFALPIAEGVPAKVLEQADGVLATGRVDRAVHGRPGRLLPRPAVPRDRRHARHPARLRGRRLRAAGRGPVDAAAAGEGRRAAARVLPGHPLLAEPPLRAGADALAPGPARRPRLALGAARGDRGAALGRGPRVRAPARSEPARPQFLHSEKPPAPAPSPAAAKAAVDDGTGRCGLRSGKRSPPRPRRRPAAPARRRVPPQGLAEANPRDLVARLVEVFRREKPDVVAALEKAEVGLEGQELVLGFSPRNRFHGDRAMKAKDALNEALAAMAPLRVRVSFVEARPETRAEDQRVELLRKVFRGEVVKGEDHGGQPV